jgi:DNA processing protein
MKLGHPILDKKLYFKGDYDDNIFDNCVAIVGSRRMTSYGERVIEKIVPPLVNAGITIVSGYMYGVDKKAHKTALECGGKSIAVLGWGIDLEKPVKNLLFISEYPGETKSQLWMFPQRNRIVAALSSTVVVIEAAEKSGSLITANFAIKYKKKLFAVPGPITSIVSTGSNNLIKSGLAAMCTSAEDILGRVAKTTYQTTSQLILLLQTEALTADELAIKMGKNAIEIGEELTLLQLKGDIFEEGGKFYPKS